MSKLPSFRWGWAGRAGAAVALLVACTGSISAISARNCVTVALADPFLLPDGSVHQAARLTLCLARSFSPVARFHQVSVDGIPVGVLLSRTGLSEGPGPKEPRVTFRRDSEGRLHLVGYAWPAGRRSLTYLLQDPRTIGAHLAVSSGPASLPTAVAGGSQDSPPLLAAIAP